MTVRQALASRIGRLQLRDDQREDLSPLDCLTDARIAYHWLISEESPNYASYPSMSPTLLRRCLSMERSLSDVALLRALLINHPKSTVEDHIAYLSSLLKSGRPQDALMALHRSRAHFKGAHREELDCRWIALGDVTAVVA